VPVGYLQTIEDFENYLLHVEWRYPGKPKNSRLFLHTTGPDLIWPNHYQCQLKYGNAGDFIIQGVGLSAKAADSVYVSTEKVKPIAIKLTESSENKAGEWNSYDIVCKGNTIEVKVNGVLLNRINNRSNTKGRIGLQTEGSKIQFRNLWVEKLN